jgi:hypothetical protein
MAPIDYKKLYEEQLKENEKLKKSIGCLTEINKQYVNIEKINNEEIDNLKKQMEKSKEIHNEYGKQQDRKIHKLEMDIVKLKNDLEIVNMLYIDDNVRKNIDECIVNGEDQMTISCGNGFYKEHKNEYIKEYVIPYISQYENGDSDYNMYKNGYYYCNMDCYEEYELIYDDDGTFCFNKIEEESYSDSEEESEDE